jgi:hypothetical protein
MSPTPETAAPKLDQLRQSWATAADEVMQHPPEQRGPLRQERDARRAEYLKAYHQQGRPALSLT